MFRFLGPDITIRVSVSPVPVPATFVLLPVGLPFGAVFLLGRRVKRLR